MPVGFCATMDVVRVNAGNLFPAPEYALHTGKPEDLGNRKTGLAETPQVFGDCYREIFMVEPAQMVPYFLLISPGPALESSPAR
jgi:hypothetical protein